MLYKKIEFAEHAVKSCDESEVSMLSTVNRGILRHPVASNRKQTGKRTAKANLYFAAQEKEPRKGNLKLAIAGLALLLTGAGVGTRDSIQANIDYDGQFNIIPKNAEEAFRIKVAGIPGILLMLPGAGLLGWGLHAPGKSSPRKDDDSDTPE
jgi:hypothetical protein